MKHCGTLKIETERLVLRRFEHGDGASAFRNWTGDPEVTRFLRWKNHSSPSETEELVDFWLKKYKDPKWYHWAIVLKETAEPVGSVSAARVDGDTDTVEVGYCLGRSFQGMGLATEALSAVIDFFFRKVGANRIEAKRAPSNRASGRVMEKCGLTYEGTLRQAERIHQGITDVCVYSILAEEYL